MHDPIGEAQEVCNEMRQIEGILTGYGHVLEQIAKGGSDTYQLAEYMHSKAREYEERRAELKVIFSLAEKSAVTK